MIKNFTEMTREQRQSAYTVLVERFNLEWDQRDRLDACSLYPMIVLNAHSQLWITVELQLTSEGII